MLSWPRLVQPKKKCDQARKASCKRRVHTDNPPTTILYESDNHNHFGNVVSSDIRRFEENARFHALNTNEGTQSILDNRLRNLLNGLPTIPHDKTFEKIPDKLCVTLRNNQLLQFDTGPGSDRIIIFSSNRQLRLLEDTKHILVDGTFRVTPTMFYPLYVIHVLYKDSVIPTIFALLPNKTHQTYQQLNEIVQHCPWWNPDYITMDFERAAYNAFRILGFKTNYETDPIFAHNVHKISALVFLPVSDVGQGFDDLYNALPSLYQPLLNYFEDTYLGRHRPTGRSDLLFPIEFWNMYQRTTELSMRTNNSAESWHRGLSSVMQCQYPSLWSFITSLQNEENSIHCQTIKLNAG
ncbi:unnamed protein product [Didymodactylos carnosus]|uniref:MULE transposase domain-containing protein n=1 Tax=Didymodactylos carnosus TaxID=1234261 RepID=A0A815QFJ7_9BILA|nr:unnamed protein product [Didymodactylos carnosus]CAF1461443.1 unnamed protein product [Didymodactylos carnosus]CAF4131108.1 unnamed protein product [Didymodactylos carnosus]CAF4331595.1 unnamed protein product [Didymodactylos carnosus]